MEAAGIAQLELASSPVVVQRRRRHCWVAEPAYVGGQARLVPDGLPLIQKLSGRAG